MINKNNPKTLLSIIIPCFNEEKTIKLILKKILKLTNVAFWYNPLFLIKDIADCTVSPHFSFIKVIMIFHKSL